MDEDGELYFIEMNTRVQVEHPVTEMVTGRRSRRASRIRVAAGEKLDLPDTRPWSFRGHAIECRINAEDPRTFAPWPGLITEYYPPGGAGVRVDSGVYGGWRVPAALRLAHRQGDRPRAHARRGHRPHAARARRVHHRRHPHEHPAAQAPPRRSRGHRRDDVDPHHRAPHRGRRLTLRALGREAERPSRIARHASRGNALYSRWCTKSGLAKSSGSVRAAARACRLVDDERPGTSSF